ncbi:MAG: hypothetical protein Q7S53_05400 [bacterium]|nr:hypothetical protein [bacterium]
MSLYKITFHGGVLNKLVKYMLIVFVAFNVLGGTVLGLHDYSQDKDAKKAFRNFYANDTAVMGAYDKKLSNSLNKYETDFIVVVAFVALLGILYSFSKREYIKKHKK